MKNQIWPKLQSALRYRYVILIIIAPVALVLTNRQSILNQPDIDVWFYNGYYRNLLSFWDTYSPGLSYTYYGTRLPSFLPGFFAHQIGGEYFGKLLFNVLLITPAISLSVYSICRKFVSDKLAFLSTILLFADPFLFRMLTSDFVSTPAIAFSVVSLAMLLKGIDKSSKKYLAFAGFSFFMAITSHLMAVIVIGHLSVILILQLRRQESFRSLAFKVLYFILGFLIAFVLFGSLFSIFTNSNQLFFFYPQLLTATSMGAIDPFAYGATKIILGSPWNLLPLVAILCSIKLVLRFSRKNWDRQTQLILFLIAPALIYLIILSIYSTSSSKLYFSRDGLYSPFINVFFLPALGAMLFGKNRLNEYLIFVMVVFFAFIKLNLDVDYFFGDYTIPFLGIIILFTLFLTNRFSQNRKHLSLLSMTLFFSLITLLPQTHTNTEATYTLSEYIKSQTNGKLPKIFWDMQSDVNSTFATTAASFTERAWWQRGDQFPNCTQPDGGSVSVGDTIVILTRKEISAEANSKFRRCMGDYELNDPKIFRFGDERYFVYLIKKTENQVYPKIFSPSELPTQNGFLKDSRLIKTTGSAGFLSYGPYLILDPGKYSCEFEYRTNAKGNFVEAVTTPQRSNEIELIARRYLSASNKASKISRLDFVIERKNQLFECRVFSPASSELEILELRIDRA